MLAWILISTFLISLISFVGLITLSLRDKILNKILIFFVALSAGAMMGGAFIHLIPESLEKLNVDEMAIPLLIGFGMFFLIEKILHWHHCHKGNCEEHTFAYMNLVGDGIHNFIDGLVIAASYMVNFNLGVTTTLAVLIHEIPQEIGDFGVLVYSGMKKNKALLLNFIFALVAMLGGLFGFLLNSFLESSMMLLLPFAAGGFIYIAASDLLPEIRKEPSLKKSMINFAVFILGIVMMYALRLIAEV